MFNRIFSTMGAVAVSAMVLVGGVLIGDGAAQAAFLTWNTSSGGNGAVVAGNWYGTSNADPSGGVGSSAYGTLSGGGSFTDIYNFDVASPGASLLFGVDTTYANPADSGIGIANLEFTFYSNPQADTMSSPSSGIFLASIISDLMTDGDGVALSGTTNFGAENWYRFGLAAGSYSLVITGDVLANGGAYATSLTAVPLPPSALLFGTALFGIGALRRRKDKKAADLAA